MNGSSAQMVQLATPDDFEIKGEESPDVQQIVIKPKLSRKLKRFFAHKKMGDVTPVCKPRHGPFFLVDRVMNSLRKSQDHRRSYSQGDNEASPRVSSPETQSIKFVEQLSERITKRRSLFRSWSSKHRHTKSTKIVADDSDDPFVSSVDQSEQLSKSELIYAHSEATLAQKPNPFNRTMSFEYDNYENVSSPWLIKYPTSPADWSLCSTNSKQYSDNFTTSNQTMASVTTSHKKEHLYQLLKQPNLCIDKPSDSDRMFTHTATLDDGNLLKVPSIFRKSSSRSIAPHPSFASHIYYPRTSASLGCTREWKSEQESHNNQEARHDLCSTWPPSLSLYDLSYLGAGSGVDYEQELIEKVQMWEGLVSLDDTSNIDMLEWFIPMKDLQFGECVTKGVATSLYKGKWHGDVLIHIRNTNSDKERSEFLEQIEMLSMIRHENIALFMGACLEQNIVGVVTSIRKGASLYQHIHIREDKFRVANKVHIARQIAQAMGYLHHKGIVLKKLCSKNVFLESKVKVSIMDYSLTEAKYERTVGGCLPKGHLTYVAPELMRTLRVEPPNLKVHGVYTQQTDIYAFGTITYELLSSTWPYVGLDDECALWSISKGYRQSVQHIRCPPHLRMLVEACWNSAPYNRPSFKEILSELQSNNSSFKRTRSVPDALINTDLRQRKTY